MTVEKLSKKKNNNDKKNKNYKEIVFGYIREFKIEIMLGVMAALSAAAYVLISCENDYKNKELSESSVRQYSFKVDIESDSDSLINTLYNDFYTVSKDIYFKYQIKNVGGTVGYYDEADSAANGRIMGRMNISVTEIEKPEECSLMSKVSGGAYIGLTVKLENLMEEECLVNINSLRLMLIDDNGYEMVNYTEDIEVSYLGPRLEECGDKLQSYFFNIGMSGVGVFEPIPLNSRGIQYLLVKKGESITFKLIYQISEEFVDDSRLAISNGTMFLGQGYNNRGFIIYLNR